MLFTKKVKLQFIKFYCNLTFFYSFYAEGQNTFVHKCFYFYPHFSDMYVFLSFFLSLSLSLSHLLPPSLSHSLSLFLSLFLSENLVPNISCYAIYAEGKVKIHTPK